MDGPQHDPIHREAIGLSGRMALLQEKKEPGGHELKAAWAMKIPRKSLILVRLAGIEPTTLGFGGRYSIH